MDNLIRLSIHRRSGLQPERRQLEHGASDDAVLRCVAVRKSIPRKIAVGGAVPAGLKTAVRASAQNARSGDISGTFRVNSTDQPRVSRHSAPGLARACVNLRPRPRQCDIWPAPRGEAKHRLSASLECMPARLNGMHALTPMLRIIHWRCLRPRPLRAYPEYDFS
jgi:hypothetical protein